MPAIFGPNPFGLTAVQQLPEHRINPILHSHQAGSRNQGERAWQPEMEKAPDARLMQGGFEAGQPVVAVFQQRASGAWYLIEDYLAFMDMAGTCSMWVSTLSQESRACSRKPEIGLPTGRVLAIACLAAKAPTPIGADKLTNGHGKAVHNRPVGSPCSRSSRIRYHSRFFTFHRLATWRIKAVQCRRANAGKKWLQWC